MAAAPDRRRPIIALACVAALGAAAATLGRGGEQAPAGRAPAADPTNRKLFVLGARGCANCHDGGRIRKDTPEELARWICRMDEFPIFDAQDKHKLAFKGLTGPRGQQMSRLLGTDVTKLEACVNCHSVPGRGIEMQQYVREDDGVTCVACHGAFEEWVEKHQSGSKAWRNLDRHDKEHRFGMTDLWDPIRRAETCASCHIGNHQEGKVITHAMYAAGHPPLPGFETSTFGDAQPPHWEYLSQKSEARLKRIMPAANPKNLESTQLVVIGGLVELRESMKLLADEAAATKPATVGARWPDFARFDCYACHHELDRAEEGSWRQARFRGGAPGRPLAPDWPMALVQLGIAAGDSASATIRQDRLDQSLSKVQHSLKSRPFGDAPTLGPAAREVAGWADSAIHDLKDTVFDAAKARTLLDRLCKLAAGRNPDYDSARQIAWAFRVIYREAVPEDRRDPEIVRELAALESELDLDLPPARKQAQIETALPDRLKKAAEFNPATFQDHFGRIAGRLAAPTPARAASR